MIGVITKESEKEIVKEFFELFKTPWEFYNDDCLYDVVLATDDNYKELNSKLTVIYGSKINGFDNEYKIGTSGQLEKVILEYNDEHFPVNGRVLTFSDGTKKPLIRAKETDEVAGIAVNLNDKKIIRVGFDLFQEIKLLLSSGQPSKYATIPTLEIHISILRNWILNSGLPLVEIPPVPAGYGFITCLTHDVDFVGISYHKFDKTMLGFIYRALLGSFIGALNGYASWGKLFMNWKAAFLLPGVYLGVIKDFFNQFDRYCEIEKGLKSTYYLIPFKDRDGNDNANQLSNGRALKYDVSDIKQEVKKLASSGCEIGLHGIDAWHDSKNGREELERISQVVGGSNIGVRMHWLFYNDYTPKILEDSGFIYDSTYGYNESVGYKGGTTQVFRPLGVKRLLELPLHIQDTALFYSGRMGLSENKAMGIVKELFNNATRYGGVLTINWHQRSIGPERFWDGFYIKLIEELKKLNVWFGTARQVVKWFDKRRSVSFNDIRTAEDKLYIQITCNKDTDVPDLILRVHNPNSTDKKKIDIPFTGKLDKVVSM